MIRDADAIKAAFAVEIDNLRHTHFAVGIIGVDVKITEQHLRAAAVALRCGTHDSFRGVVKHLGDFAGRPVFFHFAQHEFTDP